MPFVEHSDTSDFSAPIQPAPITPPVGFAGVAAAAGRQENDVYDVIDLLNRQRAWPRNPEFRIVDELQGYDAENKTSLYGNYRENFLGVESREEMLSIIGRINQENKDKETLAGAGATGVVAQIAAGLLSPTTFLPFIGAARGWRAVRAGAGWGAVGGAAQELPLQLAQETRGVSDAALSIGGGAILGGLLGGAAASISRKEFDDLVKQIESEPGIAGTHSVTPISPLSAMRVTVDEAAGRLKHALLMKATDWISPVTRTINQTDSMTFSKAMSQLSDAGLTLERNVEGVNTALGGTVENNVTTYYGYVGKALFNMDEAYSRYVNEGRPTAGLFPNLQATVKGTFSSTKLSRPEFRAEISRALRNGDEHVIAEVAEAAKFIRANVLTPVLERAKAAGLITKEMTGDDLSYLHRMYDVDRVLANPQAFIEILAKDFAERLNTQFLKRAEKFTSWEAGQTQLVSDLRLPKDEWLDAQAQLKKERIALQRAKSEEQQIIEQEITILRGLISRETRAKAAGWEERVKTHREDIKKWETEDKGIVTLAQLRQEARRIKRRERNLQKSAVVADAKQDAIFDKIEALEDANVKTMEAFGGAARRLLDKLDELSDRELDRELRKLKDQFSDLAERYDANAERIVKLGQKPGDAGPLLEADAQREKLSLKMSDAAEAIEAGENFDRVAARQLLHDVITDVAEKRTRLIEKQTRRQDELWARAEEIDSDVVLKKATEIEQRARDARTSFIERTRETGAEGIDIDTRSADFLPFARTAAENVKDRIVGTYLRLPIVEILQEKRGPELRRALQISSDKVEAFLENDVDKVLRTYIRTYGPDIEMMKRFQSVNGETVIDAAADEMNAKLTAIAKRAEKENWSQKKLEKANHEIDRQYKQLKHDFEVVTGRIRNTWGLPKDPTAMSFRIGKTLLDLNVLRLMGGTLISSIPDAARIMMRHGFTRSLGDAYAPMVSNWKQLELAGREARYAGVALDALMHMRAQGVHDTLDDVGRYSKFERGVSFLSNKMGMVNLLDQWTDMMKQVSASAIIARLGDSIDIVYGGAKATAKEREAAIEFLASKGLIGKYGEKIHAALNAPGGGTRINGVLMPNTEEWADAEAQQAFRSALAGEVQATVTTPGVERPVWVDGSMTGRLVGQFKSFAFSSVQKTLMAGLQNPADVGVVVGSTMAVAMGMLSYYIAAVVAGGDTYSKMQNASIGKWVDEGIARSGILGIFSDGQRFAERFPLTQPYANFGGDRVSRRAGDDIAEVLFGPSFSGFVGMSKVLQGLDDPTQATLREIRRLMPYQNHFALKRPLDALIESSNLPARRE